MLLLLPEAQVMLPCRSRLEAAVAETDKHESRDQAWPLSDPAAM